MRSADAQVIAMVNAPHEARAMQQKRREKEKRRKENLLNAILGLTVKLELYVIAIGLLFIAAAHGWVADWLGIIGIAICIAAGAVELGRHMGR